MRLTRAALRHGFVLTQRIVARPNLCDFGRIRAQIKASDVCQQRSLTTCEQTVLTAFQNVEDALLAHANEQPRYMALNDSVLANKRALEIANELRTTGIESCFPGDAFAA